MKCKLCLGEFQKISNSHIVPECFYSAIYNQKHQFIPITEDNHMKASIEQKGYREELLCLDCENKLSIWENKTSKDLKDITDKKTGFLNINHCKKCLPQKCVLIENINHDSFKKCMLSILWRLSVTKLELFKNYNLGDYQEDIRKILHSNSQLTTWDYPLILELVTLKQKHQSDLMLFAGKGGFINKFIRQSFILKGFLINIIISKGKVFDDYKKIFLADNGVIHLQSIEFNQLPNINNISKRLNDEDIKKFYNNK